MNGTDLQKSQNYNEPVGTMESDTKSEHLITRRIIRFH
ncbi:hypothetical protein T10_6771 [Trichinella papuae]|uniref:Uncharacterized protein n=1 Tax=Trichinella papuae TaxID=268474 RepID=A0A0V1M0B7_9BILA|nr:hypothetical protein T10_6771 [Trichinella papuae]